MRLIDVLLPLAVLVGFLGIALGGRFAQVGVIAAAILAGVDLIYLMVQ